MTKLFAIGLISLFSFLVPPIKITSVQAGLWKANSTWDCNCQPTSQDTVVIAHDSVTIDSVANCAKVMVIVGGKGHITLTGHLKTF
jgi:hypothetical protein